MEEMQEVLKEKNVPVITSAPYSNMANYSKMEEFLFKAEQDLQEISSYIGLTGMVG